MKRTIMSIATQNGNKFIFLLDESTGFAIGPGFYCKKSCHPIDDGKRENAQNERDWAGKNWDEYEEKEVTNAKHLSRLNPLFEEFMESPSSVGQSGPAMDTPFANLGNMLNG